MPNTTCIMQAMARIYTTQLPHIPDEGVFTFIKKNSNDTNIYVFTVSCSTISDEFPMKGCVF